MSGFRALIVAGVLGLFGQAGQSYESQISDVQACILEQMAHIEAGLTLVPGVESLSSDGLAQAFSAEFEQCEAESPYHAACAASDDAGACFAGVARFARAAAELERTALQQGAAQDPARYQMSLTLTDRTMARFEARQAAPLAAACLSDARARPEQCDAMVEVRRVAHLLGATHLLAAQLRAATLPEPALLREVVALDAACVTQTAQHMRQALADGPARPDHALARGAMAVRVCVSRQAALAGCAQSGAGLEPCLIGLSARTNSVQQGFAQLVRQSIDGADMRARAVALNWQAVEDGRQACLAHPGLAKGSEAVRQGFCSILLDQDKIAISKGYLAFIGGGRDE